MNGFDLTTAETTSDPHDHAVIAARAALADLDVEIPARLRYDEMQASISGDDVFFLETKRIADQQFQVKM